MGNFRKTVIGLNLKNHLQAVIASLLAFIALFLPYVRLGGEKGVATNKSVVGVIAELIKGYTNIAKSNGDSFPWVYVFVFGSVVLTIIAVVFALVSVFKTNEKIMRVWQCFQTLALVFSGLLMFSTRAIMRTSGIAGNFLNKDLSFGYWILFIASFVALVLVMSVTKTNVGYIALSVLGVIWLFPILWIVLTAFRAEQGYYVGYFIPKGFTFDNFINLFTNNSVLPFARWWCNTLIVALCSCVINTLIVLMTSYVLSRTRFAGRKAFMNILMIIGMFPGFMSLIAVYNILKGIGLNQSLMALIVVGAAGAAMGYHVSKGFFDTIPKAIDEAAIIDGASRFQIFLNVTLPLSKSIIVYTVLGSFLGAWSDYIFPSMLFGDKQSSYTVAVGLYWLTDFKRIDTYYTQFAAGAVIVAVPIVVLFVWLQRFYVEGLSGSVKG
ncbi:sugar ABC transporter permease [Butyrivibrio sp. VCB2006]|uniref:sugar ABC transporter permease n=1 Tax=Butyrivibrio sp. VCB2006 TaxID=1280679 RepID=UPI000403104E|nr:ABC transporter permease subunit [Butyrivibrio sp. VCB2006]